MSVLRNITYVAFCVIFFSLTLLGCNQTFPVPSDQEPAFTSYLDIPEITQDEINTIEKYQKQNTTFIYGMVPSTESFYNMDGELRGFSPLVCEWLTELFGITFIPANFSRANLLSGLEDGSIHFTGHLTPTPERRAVYTMTDPIAQRIVKYFRIIGSEPLSEIKETRLPRYALIEGAVISDYILRDATYQFEPVFVSDYHEAYGLLQLGGQNGGIDALLAGSLAEADFDEFGDVVALDFLPLVFSTVAVSTQTPELTPIISVIQKALENNGTRHFNNLYNQGYQEYQRYKFFAQLTDEERDFIKTNPVIPLAAEFDNYPISFLHVRTNEWQGIAFDVLDEVSTLTGLKFRIMNDPTAEFYELLRMTETGETLIITEAFHSPEREEKFLWVKPPLTEIKIALISKTETPNISFNDIYSVRVGQMRGSLYVDLFNRWFPEHPFTIEYDSQEEMFEALINDEVDVVVNNTIGHLRLINYQELVGYKLNYIFDAAKFDSTMMINKEKGTHLHSIMNKALMLIDVETISGQWLHRSYDYRVRLLEERDRARTPWLIFASVLAVIIIILILILYIRSRNAKNHQEHLVRQRTKELAYQKVMTDTLNNASIIFLSQDEKSFEHMLDDGVRVIAEPLDLDRVSIFRNHEDEGGLYTSQIYRWDKVAGGTTVPNPLLVNLSFDNLVANFKEVLIRGGQINGPVRLLPGADVLKTYGIVSTLITPIFINNHFWGSVVYEDLQNERYFDEESAEMMRSAAFLFANSIIRAQMENEIAEAAEVAIAANRVKSEFLAIMSHEIRTPMNSIMGFAELALDNDELPKKAKDYLEKITENTKWLLRIINDILDISKIEAGKLEIESIPFDLREVVSRCQSVILAEAQEKGLDLTVYAELPMNKMLIGDPVRLYQILLNLLSNAVKFTKDGVIKLSALVLEENPEKVTMTFAVKDTGIGLTPEQINIILEPFIQADSSITRKYGGTGLGLTITRNIIKAMGGELQIESQLGVGSTFGFNLTFETSLGADEATKRLKTVILEKPHFDGLVLVCDDNYMNRHVMNDHLSNVGLRTINAENGQIAVDMVLERKEKGEPPFDLILMDVFMPVMDGIEAAVKITKLGTGTPIIAVTANMMASEVEKYRKYGMPDCLGKPFTSQELWHILLKYLIPVHSSVIDMDEHDMKIVELQNTLRLNFNHDNQNRIIEMKEALSSGDIKRAHRLVHTLKSNAGLIGKKELQNMAGEVESILTPWIDSTETPPSFEEPISRLEAELAAVVEELKPLQNENEEPLPILDKEQTEKLFTELEVMLKRKNPTCVNLLSQIRRIPGTGELADLVENYKFKPALETLEILKAGGQHND